MKLRKLNIPFENQMTRTQTVCGWVYLFVHVAVLPLLLGLLLSVLPEPVDDATANLIYYLIGIVFCLTVMFPFLRRGFDRLVENFRLCLLAIVMGLLIDYALSAAATLVLMLLDAAVENPNNALIMDMTERSGGMIMAVGIFLVPIVEETLFRGVVFASIRARSRVWAYVVSVAAFSVYHVWQFAVVSGDPKMLLYALQYIPVSVALAWIYERSGCIWANIFFHMGFKALSFYVLGNLDKL